MSGEIGSVIPDDLHLGKSRLMAHVADRLLQDLMHIALLGQDVLLPGEIQKVGDDLFAPEGLLDDHFQVFPPAIVFTRFLIQGIGKEQNASQGVIDFMGDARGELAHGSQLLFVKQFLLGAVNGFGHLIEGPAQDGQFSTRLGRGPAPSYPLGQDDGSRLHQFIDRPENKSRDRQGDHPGKENAD